MLCRYFELRSIIVCHAPQAETRESVLLTGHTEHRRGVYFLLADSAVDNLKLPDLIFEPPVLNLDPFDVHFLSPPFSQDFYFFGQGFHCDDPFVTYNLQRQTFIASN